MTVTATENRLSITGRNETIVFTCPAGGVPNIALWAPTDPSGQRESAWSPARAVPHGMLDEGEIFDCFPEAGRGFTGHPAIRCRRESGAFVSQLSLKRWTSSGNAADIELEDIEFGLAVHISYVLDPATDVLQASTKVTNTGSDRLYLEWVAAAVLPSEFDHLQTFGGSWAHEFQPVRNRLTDGIVAKENNTGRTSHHAPPFIFAGSPDFGEERGQVVAAHLAWSGNHKIFTERLRDGRVQIQLGESFLPGEMALEPSTNYEAPKVYAALSNAGLNGISAKLHPFVRATILQNRLIAKPRPVHFNTWEAVYFAQTVDTMKELASSAALLGVERFVLDDGWFRGRDDDRTSLGDWTADTKKYPQGLTPLIEHVRSLGMEFGLWVEPEMANADSDLLRSHPDWILGIMGRTQPLGRGQYVLDLTRAEVSDHIFSQMDSLLRNHEISYLKWDMNRDLTHAASGGKPAAHAQAKAVYALLDRLRAAHPGVEIESCSSGGGRADYEILKRTDRVWPSDCNDPIERQLIQRGFSIVFPPEVMGSHVGPRQSHTTARSASLQLRALTAFFGHMGIEGDVRAFSDRERDELARWIALHKSFRPLLHGGVTRRLETQDRGLVAFLIEASDVLVSAAQVATSDFPSTASLRIPDLPSEDMYEVQLLNPSTHPQRTMKVVPRVSTGASITMSTNDLAYRGIALPILRAGEIAVFHLKRCPR